MQQECQTGILSNRRRLNRGRSKSTEFDQGLHSRKRVKTFQALSHLKNPYEKIPFIPSYRMTVDQMKADPLELFMKLQEKYKNYGAIKLITPAQWNPPFSFKQSSLGITSRIQPLHKLKSGKAFQEKKEAYNIQSFYEYAEFFQRKYKPKFIEAETLEQCSSKEFEYWKLVAGPTPQQQEQNPKKYKVTVEYAADLQTNKYGSCFPISQSRQNSSQHFNYSSNLFNLNNLYKSENSLLKIADSNRQFISGITIPWIYIGMMFSTFCWHVEDSQINSINYNHQGSIKTWYVVPASDKAKLEGYFKKKHQNKNHFLEKITYMIDPLELIQNGINVYKIYHTPKSYVVTFFDAYHCGFSQGFNIGEAVNFVIPESLKYIKNSESNYEYMKFKPSVFCYEWLVCRNYEKQHFKMLKDEYQIVLKNQFTQLQKLLNKFHIKKVSFFQDQHKFNKFCCHQCKKYLYLSFFKCKTCSKDYCYSDVNECCNKKQFILVVREIKKDRSSIAGLLKQYSIVE